MSPARGPGAGRGKRTDSSTRWLRRQHADPYVQRARAEGYRSRSAYKLLEIDASAGLLRRGARVVDLGAAPGGWLQVATAKGCRVVGIDLLPVEPVAGATVLQGDALDPAEQARLRDALGGSADVVLSDMAASSTGTRAVDRLRAEALGEAVLAFAAEVLAPDGALVLKLVKGAESALVEQAKRSFRRTRLVRPPATRRESSEMYFVAQGFHGGPVG
jgi:23S rRNA (uridine2552-2'-O)-methyltransferase